MTKPLGVLGVAELVIMTALASGLLAFALRAIAVSWPVVGAIVALVPVGVVLGRRQHPALAHLVYTLACFTAAAVLYRKLAG